jgi:dephospho-CoA kinase
MHKLKSNHINLNEKTRLYQCPVPIIGLTGSIATGKSTVTKVLRNAGLAVIDADMLVKDIYKDNKTIEFIRDTAPNCIQKTSDGPDLSVNFKALRDIFFQNSQVKSKIENFIYPLLPIKFLEALENCDLGEVDFIIYDVPLLFEKGLIPFVDDFVLVYTDEKEQLKRLLKRDSISLAQAKDILAAQTTIEEKKLQSVNIIDNSEGFLELESNTLDMLAKLTQ